MALGAAANAGAGWCVVTLIAPTVPRGSVRPTALRWTPLARPARHRNRLRSWVAVPACALGKIVSRACAETRSPRSGVSAFPRGTVGTINRFAPSGRRGDRRNSAALHCSGFAAPYDKQARWLMRALCGVVGLWLVRAYGRIGVAADRRATGGSFRYNPRR